MGKKKSNLHISYIGDTCSLIGFYTLDLPQLKFFGRNTRFIKETGLAKSHHETKLPQQQPNMSGKRGRGVQIASKDAIHRQIENMQYKRNAYPT